MKCSGMDMSRGRPVNCGLPSGHEGECRGVCSICGYAVPQGSDGWHKCLTLSEIGWKSYNLARELRGSCACGHLSTHESGWCGVADCYNPHPTTGHHRAIQRPWKFEGHGETSDIYLPPYGSAEVKVSRDLACDDSPTSVYSGVCSRGTRACAFEHTEDEVQGKVWYVEIKTHDGVRLTAGSSIANALEMAADLMKLDHNECKDPEVPHCFCRDIAWSTTWGDDYVIRAKRCCLCMFESNAGEFE